MPLKLNVGLSKKMGLPRYGSLGAACHVEVELESSLLANDAQRFQEHVRRAYLACAQAVNDELARHRGEDATLGHRCDHPSREPGNGQGSSHEHSHENGHGNGPANGHNGASADRPATARQLDFAGQLAVQIGGLGSQELDTLVGRLFHKPLADLTSPEASSLIDTLKAIKAGQVDLQAALNGTSANANDE